MYDAIADPYCYAGTSVLKNIPGLRDQADLDAFEAISTAQRAEEPLPNGRLSVSHYPAIHRHLFQDVYSWAERFRTVRMSKGASAFCYPENIPRGMKTLFADLRRRNFPRGLSTEEFAEHGAHFLAMLNAIHPFREGYGRTQTVFFALLAHSVGHPLDLDRLEPARFLRAMIESFHGNEEALAAEIRSLVTY